MGNDYLGKVSFKRFFDTSFGLVVRRWQSFGFFCAVGAFGISADFLVRSLTLLIFSRCWVGEQKNEDKFFDETILLLREASHSVIFASTIFFTSFRGLVEIGTEEARLIHHIPIIRTTVVFYIVAQTCCNGTTHHSLFVIFPKWRIFCIIPTTC